VTRGSFPPDAGRRAEAAGSDAARREALADLVPAVYAELRRLAAAYLRRERPGQTLQATALVHEAYLRLLGERHVAWQDPRISARSRRSRCARS
jgi:DNA-directed RNA polymerase specialized sigma24 family protein